MAGKEDGGGHVFWLIFRTVSWGDKAESTEAIIGKSDAKRIIDLRRN
jgi:hypothetical protein